MSSIIRDIFIDRAISFEAPVTIPDLEQLRDLAYGRTWELAEAYNIYNHAAYDNLTAFSEHEPDAAEVVEMLSKDELGDWRRCMVVAATIATDRYLTAKVEKDLAKLEAALVEAQEEGYKVQAITAECPHGWAAHTSESDWANGTLHRWVKLEGDTDAAMLRVLLHGAAVWLDLHPVE